MIVMTAPRSRSAGSWHRPRYPGTTDGAATNAYLPAPSTTAPQDSAAISEAPGRTQSDARAYSRHASRRPLLMTSWCELAADTASPAPGDARPDAMPLDQRSGAKSLAAVSPIASSSGGAGCTQSRWAESREPQPRAD